MDKPRTRVLEIMQAQAPAYVVEAVDTDEAKAWLSVPMDEVVQLFVVAGPSNSLQCKQQQMPVPVVQAMTSREEVALLDITGNHPEILKETGGTNPLRVKRLLKTSKVPWVTSRISSSKVTSNLDIAIVAP